MPLVLNGTTGVQDNSGAFVIGTAVNSTSGTSIDYTSIPSWVKRITVMFNGVSSSGSSNYQIQIGAASFTTSGYTGAYAYLGPGSTGAGNSNATGFIVFHDTVANVRSGAITISLLDSATNTWVGSGTTGDTGNYTFLTNYSVAISGTLARVRVTTVNGTDTFTAGKINILYE
jgi:hypothetical protein